MENTTLRVDRQLKRGLDAAARLQGEPTRSAYMRRVLRESVRRDLRRHVDGDGQESDGGE